MLMDNYRFKGIQVGYLPRDLFINGNRWAPWGIPSERPLPYNPLIFHSSWTNGLNNKILKFITVGQWFSTCKLFKSELVPKINVTEQFTEFMGYNKNLNDWHYIVQKMIHNLFKPSWNMSSLGKNLSKPELDTVAGTWFPNQKSEKLF